ncbi:gamma-butyrobetaine dioxygenase [Exophiala viscosa]|uniref:Gamma-butyrobetaine dioxygenase n=1 Tax=Exophiala viscosa TaxID=2486360 RepID=A0AAN6E700_9EURO|nr:gamma-butyrobetaine dioxygenase [Exophiala viscosa]KAI1628149.1 gamma-butyrobetaine dioxygenase [Exophiala viscosa]
MHTSSLFRSHLGRSLKYLNVTGHTTTRSRIKLNVPRCHQTRTLNIGTGWGTLTKKVGIPTIRKQLVRGRRRGKVKTPFGTELTTTAHDDADPGAQDGNSVYEPVNPLEQVSSTTGVRQPLISPILVRDACKCSQCIDSSDKQRNFSYSDIPSDTSFRDVQLDEKTGIVKVRWNNDIPSASPDHTSTFDHETIANLTAIYRHQQRYKLTKRPLRLWDQKSFQRDTSRIDFNDYMTHGPTFANAMHLLWRDGLLFLDGVPETEDSVAQIVNRIGPLQQTFYGPTWDVRSVPNAKNVAYTSKYLSFHMDLLYMRDPPGFQFLHCVHNTCEGGESRFADTFKALDQLISEYGTEYFDALRNFLIRYEYDNDGFFYSDQKPTVMDRGKVDEPPRQIMFAQHEQLIRDVGRVFWSPPFVGYIEPQASEKEHALFVKASKAFSDIMEQQQNVVEEKMDSGTCVIFDNLRVVHARNAFNMNSGKRWLRGAYLNRQDFISKAVSVVDDMPMMRKGRFYQFIPNPEGEADADTTPISGKLPA